MEKDTINVRIQWNWGRIEVLEACRFATIFEFLESAGIRETRGRQIVVAYKGKILDKRLTLSYYRIVDGSKLVLAMKRVPNKEQSEQFLEMLRSLKKQVGYNRTRLKASNSVKSREYARLNDLSWARWDSSPDCMLLTCEILKQQEQRNMTIKQSQMTIVDNVRKICEEPLPNVFGREGFVED